MLDSIGRGRRAPVGQVVATMDVTDWLRGLGLERYAANFVENEVGAELLPKLTAQDLQDLGVAAVGHRRRLLDAIAAPRGEDQPAGAPPATLAYFGWPNADEAHADSAVRAGLASIEAVRPHGLSVRVGIATGLVVVGDLIGAGAAQEHPAIGETPNLAAWLQALAEPDTVVVSEATRAQLGRMFELEELGPVALKGFDKPVKAWRARGETGPASRSEAIYAGTLTPLVGRDEELDLLLRRWRQAKTGEGRVVLLSGEAGMITSVNVVEIRAS